MKPEIYSKLQSNMEHNKNLDKIKTSIQELFDKSDQEKVNLFESIEMLWLDSSIKKKKKEVSLPEKLNSNVVRIRQLLAAAWLEDLKEEFTFLV